MSDYHAVKRALQSAMAHGAKTIQFGHCEWTISGNCTDPVYKDLHAYPPKTGASLNITPGKTRTPLRLELWIRCGKCECCLRKRAAMWTIRATTECRQSIRTWFGTLTIAPEHQHAAYATACREYASSGDFDGLDYKAQFARRVSVLNREVTRYVKRVRKQSKALLRILFVTEHHKSGLPHFHALIHEHDLHGVTEEMLRSQWKLGFTKWRLIESPQEAAYVCKYASKSGASKIRASLHYGQTSLDIAKVFTPLACSNNHPNTTRSHSRTNGADMESETSVAVLGTEQ